MYEVHCNRTRSYACVEKRSKNLYSRRIEPKAFDTPSLPWNVYSIHFRSSLPRGGVHKNNCNLYTLYTFHSSLPRGGVHKNNCKLYTLYTFSRMSYPSRFGVGRLFVSLTFGRNRTTQRVYACVVHRSKKILSLDIIVLWLFFEASKILPLGNCKKERKTWCTTIWAMPWKCSRLFCKQAYAQSITFLLFFFPLFAIPLAYSYLWLRRRYFHSRIHQ